MKHNNSSSEGFLMEMFFNKTLFYANETQYMFRINKNMLILIKKTLKI